MRFSEILFPTDFSPASEAAAQIAQAMARPAGARLHVLHVVTPVTDPSLPAESLALVAKKLGEGLRVEPVLLNRRAGPDPPAPTRA